MIDADEIGVHDPEIETVVQSLINYLNTDERMGSLIDQFYDEWPDANQGEYEKTMAIHTVRATHTDAMKEVKNVQEVLNDSINVAVSYSTGYYDINLQVDIWCPYKHQRNELYQKFYDIINEEFLTKDNVSKGLSLTLENYFDTIARYDIVGYNFPDSERASQENDFRAVIDMTVHFDKIMQKKQPKMTQIEITEQDISDNADIS